MTYKWKYTEKPRYHSHIDSEFTAENYIANIIFVCESVKNSPTVIADKSLTNVFNTIIVSAKSAWELMETKEKTT